MQRLCLSSVKYTIDGILIIVNDIIGDISVAELPEAAALNWKMKILKFHVYFTQVKTGELKK